MKLITAKLTQFKGIKSFTLDAQGKDCVIEGANGLGKTTIADAYLFALVGKDSLGQAPGTGGFEIKTLAKDGSVLKHGVDHEVELVVDVDGTHLSFRKVYKEQWTTRRGSADKEFTGHIVEHYIDGVPKSKGEYDSFVASICDPKKLLILSQPRYFNELPDDSKLGAGWIQRRKVLIDAFGDVSDSDVMGSAKKFKPLVDAMKARTVDDFKKVLAVDKKKAVDARKEIPGRIDELNRQLTSAPAPMSPSSSLVTPLAPQQDGTLPSLRARLKELNERRAQIQAGGHAGEMTKRLRELEAEGQAIYNRLRAAAEEEAHEAAKTLRQANFVLEGEKQSLEKVKREKQSENAVILTDEQSLTNLREEFAKISAKTLDLSRAVASICPACKQPVPEDALEAAHAAALEEFNQRKSALLEENRKCGKDIKQRCDHYKTLAVEHDEEITRLMASIADLTKQRDEAQELANDALPVLSLTLNPEYQVNFTHQETLKARIAAAAQNDGGELYAVDMEIGECETEIEACDKAEARAAAQDDARKRIKDLEGQEKTLGAEIESIDKLLFLIEEFTKAKVVMLDDKINAKFSLVKWKLSEIQINEGVKDCCVCTVAGVPEPSLNHAMRIQAGIEIINVLSDAWGIQVPVWIDGAESINDIPPTRGQQIALRVPDLNKSPFETEDAWKMRVKAAQKLTVSVK